MRRSGFTLIEIAVASVLLQVSLLGVLGTLIRAVELRSEAERLEQTISAAESVLDSLLALDSIDSGGSLSRGGVQLAWSLSGLDLRVVAQGGEHAQVVLVGWVAP